MSKLNSVKLEGYVSTEPKLTATAGGWFQVRFNLNVLRVGVKSETAQKNDFIPVKYLTKSDEAAERIKKGQRVSVEGMLQIDRAEKDGVKQNYTNVLTFDVKPVEVTGPAESKPKEKPEFDIDNIDLEDLPF